MTISNMDESSFREILKQNLTPSRAITSPEHLRGRERMLMQISRAFNSPGKHVFIFGDRGVGKTSLAQTAASIQQSSDAEPILVSCAGSTFFGAVRDAVKQSLPLGDLVFKKKVEQKLRGGSSSFGFDLGRTLESGVIPQIDSVNDAVQLLRFLAEFHSREPVIIFDEFDQLLGDEDRKACADVVKHVSERIDIRFIICGIGSSLEKLIGAHLSAERYISPIPLERLTHDARWEIIQNAAQAVGVDIPYAHRIRIGQISDGFPSYIHLITEKILWCMFDDPNPVTICSTEHFRAGVSEAVQETVTTSKAIYDKATQKHSDDYQEVLWALADGHVLRRQTTEVFDQSYQRIMLDRHTRKHLSKEQFSGRLNNLKTTNYGEIIIGRGAGWYEFRENIVRGYVRMRAEHEGVIIGVEAPNNR